MQNKLKRTTGFLNKASNEAKRSTENLTKATKDDTDATKKNNEEKGKQKNALEELARSVLQVGSGLGIEHKLKEIMNIGSKFEMSRLNLATVLGVDMADKQLTKFTNHFEKLAESGIGAYEDISETGYALLSAGLSKQESLVGTKIAMEVAAITRGKGEEVANVMATATKDFHLLSISNYNRPKIKKHLFENILNIISYILVALLFFIPILIHFFINICIIYIDLYVISFFIICLTTFLNINISFKKKHVNSVNKS